MNLKKHITRLWKDFLSIWYMPKWLAPIICYFFGHKPIGVQRIYQQEKIRKKQNNIIVKHRYDNYIKIYCSRCEKGLRTVRTNRKQTEKQAKENAIKLSRRK